MNMAIHLHRLKARYYPYVLRFKSPSGTSQGVLTERPIWVLLLSERDNPTVYGIGECAPLKGFSKDDFPGFKAMLHQLCEDKDPCHYLHNDKLNPFPSIRFGLEMALTDLRNGGRRLLFKSDFTRGKSPIVINGLIWMGSYREMQARIEEKIAAGFRCLKMKIGAIDFEEELSLLRQIRKHFSADELELRVDANGAFTAKEATLRLQQLAELEIHSIEQPIRPGQPDAMADLCRKSPIPIALDEEIAGVLAPEDKLRLLQHIRPHYIILKPTLVGGFEEAEAWIRLAESFGIGWWITSALESTIGLNAIAQWTFTLNNPMPQGLGTGQLYVNNFTSPLFLDGDRLFYHPRGHWHFPAEWQ